MSEENVSEPLNFYIIIFGLIIISISVLIPIIRSINIFVYFFSKSNSEYVSESLSELITVSSGVPGNVEIIFVKPSEGKYKLKFNQKMIYAEMYDYKKPLGISDDIIEKNSKQSYYSSAVNFKSSDILDFILIEIKKEKEIIIESKGS
ncbi:MAG: hypothetical protein QW350_01570 [Candidatus Aenigmatarchaeota archaeon]|nr:hypothetical protein [Candidatus Aenigmarchaeota archaeon]